MFNLSRENPKERTGQSVSLWMETDLPSFSSLQNDLDVDICIVGGGIAGLTSAYCLLKEGYSVAVLDRGPIGGGGQTARTTGHLTWILDDRFTELEKLFGEDGLKKAVESHRAAVDTIEKIILENGINCDFERIDGYLFLTPEESESLLNDEKKAGLLAGLEVHKVERLPIDAFNSGPALVFPNQAQFHVLKYLSGLIKAIVDLGGRLYSHSLVQSCEDGNPCLVHTEKYKVTAKELIIATNSPINDRVIIHTKQAPYRTYVFAALIPKGIVSKALYWDTGDPYHYIRLQNHGEDPTMEWLILGGEDHKTGQDKNPEEKYQILESWARTRFPEMREISYKWSGQVMEPIDCLAFIGRNPGDKHTFIVTGDSGNGLTHGTLAALLLTDLIKGKENPWTSIYDPSRKNIHSLNEFAKENFNVACQYAKWLGPGEVNSSQDIPKDTGAILQDGLKKEAVYRDKEGQLHTLSAVCPHLGCIVEWNNAEKSWDCPCHGSRFDKDGTIINGPATSNLTPK